MGETTKTCFKTVINSLNALTILIGLAVTGASIALLVERNRNGALLDGLEDTSWAVWMPLVVGIALVLVGGVGCCVTVAENRCLLSLFALLQLAFGLAIVAAGAAVLIYTDTINTVAETTNVWSLSGTPSKEGINDYTTGLYGACCVSSESFLESVNKCTASNNDGYCYFDEDVFAVGAEANQEACDEIVVGELCEESSSGSAEQLKEFQANVYDFTREYVWPSSVAFVVFGSVLLLAFVGSIYIACNAS